MQVNNYHAADHKCLKIHVFHLFNYKIQANLY